MVCVPRIFARRLQKPQSFVSTYERGQRRIDFLEFAHVMIALGQDPVAVGSVHLKEVVPHIVAKRDADTLP